MTAGVSVLFVTGNVPDARCGSGEYGSTSMAFDVAAAVGAFGFAVAAVLAIFCRRRWLTRVGGFVGYALLTPPAAILMALASKSLRHVLTMPGRVSCVCMTESLQLGSTAAIPGAAVVCCSTPLPRIPV